MSMGLATLLGGVLVVAGGAPQSDALEITKVILATSLERDGVGITGERILQPYSRSQRLEIAARVGAPIEVLDDLLAKNVDAWSDPKRLEKWIRDFPKPPGVVYLDPLAVRSYFSDPSAALDSAGRFSMAAAEAHWEEFRIRNGVRRIYGFSEPALSKDRDLALIYCSDSWGPLGSTSEVILLRRVQGSWRIEKRYTLSMA